MPRFLHILPLLALSLPTLAEMPAGLKPGDKEKDVRRKVAASDDFTALNSRAKVRLDNTYRLSTNIAGQQWTAHFTIDRRNKELTKLFFVNNKSMQPSQYNGLLKPFYVFTLKHIREHFKLQNPVNLPEFGSPNSLKVEEIFPLHTHPGEGIMLTTGLWKAKDGGIHLCFSMEPATQSALGQTYTSNTSGRAEEWEDIPDFTATAAGKAFLEETGLAGGGKAPEPEVVEEPTATFAAVPTSLPQTEQDVLNALQMLISGNSAEGAELLLSAAKAGNARALYELACCCADGLYGITRDEEQAETAFRKAATAGFALALVRYGAEFPTAINALGITAEDGLKMLRTAEGAEASSPTNRFNHAIMLRYGYGLRKDAAQALSIMRDLVAEGDPVAVKLVQEWEQ